MYCVNCGCRLFGKECEWCGPAELHNGREKYCKDCGELVKEEVPDEPA